MLNFQTRNESSKYPSQLDCVRANVKKSSLDFFDSKSNKIGKKSFWNKNLKLQIAIE
jgi:hypothetical protein